MKKETKKMIWLELGIIFLILTIFIIIKFDIIKLMPTCIINKNFGILCPSCGGTRCIINFAIGNYKESFLYHPIFFMTIVYLIVINILHIINCFRKEKIATFLYPKEKFWMVFVIILIIYTIIRNII